MIKVPSTLYHFLLQAFNYIDSDGDHIIDRDTFCAEATKEVLENWLGPREDWAEEFDSIDMTNKKGDGNVLFRVSQKIANNFKNPYHGWYEGC